VLAGAACVLIERDADIINGASKGNSAILHTGFDAPAESLELGCIREGAALYGEIHARLGLPLQRIGAIVAAWNEAEAAALDGIVVRAHANGVREIRLIGPEELRASEPALAPAALAGVLVPGEAIIDPWSAPLAYVLQGMANGGTVLRGTEVVGGSLSDGCWRLEASGRPVRPRAVINCAGNHGDLVEAIARPPPFSIRKGQFVVFDKSHTDWRDSSYCRCRPSGRRAWW
jgi:glycerol-3-phosphate dehydrogenase